MEYFQYYRESCSQQQYYATCLLLYPRHIKLFISRLYTSHHPQIRKGPYYNSLLQHLSLGSLQLCQFFSIILFPLQTVSPQLHCSFACSISFLFSFYWACLWFSTSLHCMLYVHATHGLHMWIYVATKPNLPEFGIDYSFTKAGMKTLLYLHAVYVCRFAHTQGSQVCSISQWNLSFCCLSFALDGFTTTVYLQILGLQKKKKKKFCPDHITDQSV